MRITSKSIPACVELTAFLRDLRDLAWKPRAENPVDKLFFLNASDITGAFGSSGQRCTATSRVVVEEAIADQFVQMIVEQTRKLKVGNGLDPDVDVGPLVDEQQLKTVLRYLEIGKKEARLLHGGVRIAGGDYENGYFVAPTVFDHVPWDGTIAQEEIFGPVLSVIRVPNFEEALRVAKGLYQFGNGLFSAVP